MSSFCNLCTHLTLTPLFFLLIFLTNFVASANPTYLSHKCPNTTTFTRNSTYFANLSILLSSLSSPNASYAAGFQNASAGRSPDMVYGLFLCRGDFSAQVCGDCVAYSVNDTLNLCTKEKEVVIWYDECMLRYSHRNILSSMEMDPAVHISNNQNVTINVPLRSNVNLLDSMYDAAEEAANNSRKFALKIVKFTASNDNINIYGLVQCTPDLMREKCNDCLENAISQLPACCDRKIGGRVLFPSCNARYELDPFYNQSALAAPPRQSPGSITQPRRSRRGLSVIVIVIAIVVSVASVLLFIGGYCFLASKERKKYNAKYNAAPEENAGNGITTAKSLQYDFSTIEASTNKFSESNKLGEGGFGLVYQGTLPDGKGIAVKRLSKGSQQGEEEFKNEVVSLAKLRHRNLVRLLGFCSEGEEKILVYEFVPNKSLDYFLFDPKKQCQLDWSRRYKIIDGIVRGIIYLHQDSPLTIIHRDLKASNILLDADMNPKISDFGTARIFGEDQTHTMTSRIVGTRGYMSPEYVLLGQFSMKSDVYSFGVLVLEIISGKKNRVFSQTDVAGDLVRHARKLWSDGKSLELLDPAMGENCERDEVMRCIDIGLSCVEEDPTNRPTLADIILTMDSSSTTLPVPQEPAFFCHSKQESDLDGNGLKSGQSTYKSIPWSVDDDSITELHPR